MDELVPNTTDAAQEKHVPVIQVSGNIVTVTVGSVLHPMQPEHYIEWISLHTKEGNQRKELKPGDAPKAVFALVDGDEVESRLCLLQPPRVVEEVRKAVNGQLSMGSGRWKPA